MKICFADIETTSIPSIGVAYVDTIHCIGVKSGDSPTLMYTSRFLPLTNYGGTLRNALDVINQHDIVVGHHFIGFDLIVIENLLGHVTATVLDTMLLAKLLYTKDELSQLDYTIPDFPKDQYGSFSLDSFGRRMGEYKGSHSDWSKLTSAMADYCTQDVEVTYHLYHNLITHQNYPLQSVIDLEHEVAYIIAQQIHYGFYYDIDAGRQLMQKLMHEQLSLSIKLSRIFKPKFLPDGKPVIPARDRRASEWVENTSYIGF